MIIGKVLWSMLKRLSPRLNIWCENLMKADCDIIILMIRLKSKKKYLKKHIIGLLYKNYLISLTAIYFTVLYYNIL